MMRLLFSDAVAMATVRRQLQNQLVVKRCNSSNTEAAKVKPFEEIPGPRGLPFLGNLWRYLPGIGEYSFDRLHHNGLKKYLKYGPIVREEIVPGVNLVLLYRPEDIETMYRVEGRYPSRRSHTALEHYRLQRPHLYNTGGLLPTNGPEWFRLRMTLQRPISTPQSVKVYIKDIDIICKEFAGRIAGKLKSSEDFLDDLARVFLEFTGLFTFDTRLGALSSDLNAESMPMRLIQAAADTNQQILKTDNGLQLWRRFETPSYKKLRKAQEYFEQVALEYIHAKRREMETSKETTKKTVLEVYLSSPDLDVKDVTAMVGDMLLAGIDTSSFTMGFILYHLAKNPEKQAELRKEVISVVRNRNIDENTLASMPYLKAVVKETFRMNPISIGVGRILPADAVFSGYNIPKDSILVSQNQVSCRLPIYFSNPDQFVPERWIKGSELQEKPHPFLVLPFGHGPRACIGRRLAEQNIYILLARIIERFEVTWTGDGLDCVSQLINRPDKPLKFEFREKKD